MFRTMPDSLAMRANRLDSGFIQVIFFNQRINTMTNHLCQCNISLAHAVNFIVIRQSQCHQLIPKVRIKCQSECGMKLEWIKRSSNNIDTIHARAGHYPNIDRCHGYS